MVFRRAVKVGDRFGQPWESMHSPNPWNVPTFRLWREVWPRKDTRNKWPERYKRRGNGYRKLLESYQMLQSTQVIANIDIVLSFKVFSYVWSHLTLLKGIWSRQYMNTNNYLLDFIIKRFFLILQRAIF